MNAVHESGGVGGGEVCISCLRVGDRWLREAGGGGTWTHVLIMRYHMRKAFMH